MPSPEDSLGGVWEALLGRILGTGLPLAYTVPEHIRLAYFISMSFDVFKDGASTGAARLSVFNRAGQVRVAVPDTTVIPVALTTRVSWSNQGATSLLAADNIHANVFPAIEIIGGDVIRFDMTNGIATDLIGPALVTLGLLQVGPV